VAEIETSFRPLPRKPGRFAGVFAHRSRRLFSGNIGGVLALQPSSTQMGLVCALCHPSRSGVVRLPLPRKTFALARTPLQRRTFVCRARFPAHRLDLDQVHTALFTRVGGQYRVSKSTRVRLSRTHARLAPLSCRVPVVPSRRALCEA